MLFRSLSAAIIVLVTVFGFLSVAQHIALENEMMTDVKVHSVGFTSWEYTVGLCLLKRVTFTVLFFT